MNTLPELRRLLLLNNPDLVVTTVVPAPGEAVLRHGILRRAVADVPSCRSS